MSKKKVLPAGHVRAKNGWFYTVINCYDANGERKPKWEKTGISTKYGSKKEAEAILQERRMNFVVPGSDIQLITSTADEAAQMLFADFMVQWLEMKKTQVMATTYDGYETSVNRVIAPYFRDRALRLCDLRPMHFMEFINERFRLGNASSTVRAYYAVLKMALKFAVNMEILPNNPMDKVSKPKLEKHIYVTHDSDELNKLVKLIRATPLEIPVLLSALYGLRRGEACGMRWSKIDFKYNTITINHVMTMSKDKKGKRRPVPRDLPKNSSSIRTLPMTEELKVRLLEIKAEQKENKKDFGDCYNNDWDGYLCVRADGSLITPEYVTRNYPLFLKKHNLTRICFHNVRHSFATLMQKERIGIDYISKFLGHSDISTTANIYCHMDMEMLEKPANKMAEIIEL